MEIVYTQGKHIVLADALSRSAIWNGEHVESSTDAEMPATGHYTSEGWLA